MRSEFEWVSFVLVFGLVFVFGVLCVWACLGCVGGMLECVLNTPRCVSGVLVA